MLESVGAGAFVTDVHAVRMKVTAIVIQEAKCILYLHVMSSDYFIS
jgi:hypothetical protein